MLTLKLGFGGTTLAGLTYSDDVEQITVVEGLVAALTVSSEAMHLFDRTSDNNTMVHTLAAENFASALTLSLIVQADSLTAIDYLEGRYAGLKNVIVELIP
jgi:hypothetical protein